MRFAGASGAGAVSGRAFVRGLAFGAAAGLFVCGGLLAFNAAQGGRLAALLGGALAVILFILCLFLVKAGSSATGLFHGRSDRFDPQQFLDTSEEAAFIMDASGGLVAGNAHLSALLGVDGAVDELTRILPSPILEAITIAFDLGLDSTGTIECENHIGEWLTVEARFRRIEIKGAPAFAFTIRDLTEARRREIELATLAFQDPLTRLANRAALQRRLSRLGDDLGEGPEASFAIMVLDLNRFKQVNDKLGHAAGDELLQEISRRIVEAVPRNAFVARNGGDEFVVVVGPRANYASMRVVGQHIVDAVARPVSLASGPAEVGVSIGIALTPADGDDPAALLHAADNAMYRAKQGPTGFAFVNEPEDMKALKSVA